MEQQETTAAVSSQVPRHLVLALVLPALWPMGMESWRPAPGGHEMSMEHWVQPLTFHEGRPGCGPLAPPVCRQQADGRQALVLAGSQLDYLSQLSEQIPLTETAEIYDNIQDEELWDRQVGCVTRRWAGSGDAPGVGQCGEGARLRVIPAGVTNTMLMTAIRAMSNAAKCLLGWFLLSPCPTSYAICWGREGWGDWADQN